MVRKEYLNELANIRSTVIGMGEKTVASVLNATSALAERDSEMAAASRQYEKDVDKIYTAVDETCIRTMATQQPAATDLRFLVATMKIATEVERIADYANNIAKIVQKKFPQVDVTHIVPLSPTVKSMGDLAATMLSDAMRAYATNDPDLASEVIGRDDAVDRIRKDLFVKLISNATADAKALEAILELHTAIRYIERVADRSTNIAEWVFYVATGYKMPDEKPGK
ncbi:phosphate signaling complex protein PhoU [Acetonema longum]|uniref:Phosphate-specific transport system accessory protein PhoU n=1 Tax=Acetonema longum DSM 6540 TaxID=1009370 RepID=F7NI37_9FIRM|nr:phosphate signaling complex protein PhoU [Acetonema longum]EGO64269.1 phosphate uptake regulator, PhoU [Acetonema longum DSM 6540]